jgi:peptidoglycan/LPS O-acetylase OafA/YrhL
MTTTAVGPQSRTSTRIGHLWQIDIVRILTFACVIAVHAAATVNAPTSVAAGASLMLLHFTREVFFLITGFVLVHTHGRRPLAVGPFWRRRFLLVGVPYVVWSVIYYALNTPDAWSAGWVGRLGTDLLTGTACYHLYFLLVSLQVYLVFPLLRKLLRVSEGRHGWLLGTALALQLGETMWLQYAGPSDGVLGVLAEHADALLPTYVGYLVAGALAAWHLTRWQQWVQAHSVLVVLALVGSSGVALGAFALQLHGPDSVVHAQAALQPAMLPWSLAVAAGLYAMGSWWARPRAGGPRTSGGSGRSAVSVGSRISFGVYLVHPMVMQFFAEHGVTRALLPALPATALLWLLSVGVSVVAVLVGQRSVLSQPLTGRPHARSTR